MESGLQNLRRLTDELTPYRARLIAVSKTKPVAQVKEVYEAGQRDFGENYVQELVDKRPLLPEDIRWHFIGHLQTNKVRHIAGFIHCIHTVDSYRLLREIDKQAAKHNRVIPCLLQVYIANEETKFGLSIDEAEEVLKAAQQEQLDHVRIIGFMGMASNTDDTDKVRSEFRQLKLFFERMKTNYEGLSELSMGMSSDYRIALEEGSTMIRIGSSIFGARSYSTEQ